MDQGHEEDEGEAIDLLLRLRNPSDASSDYSSGSSSGESDGESDNNDKNHHSPRSYDNDEQAYSLSDGEDKMAAMNTDGPTSRSRGGSMYVKWKELLTSSLASHGRLGMPGYLTGQRSTQPDRVREVPSERGLSLIEAMERVGRTNSKSEEDSESESDTTRPEADVEDHDENGADEDEPYEEEFSEGDEYVERVSSRRKRSSPSRVAQSAVPPKAISNDQNVGQVLLPSSSPSSAAGKKSRKPKYSAALEARWEEKFEWLMTYKRATGNCRVAEGNKEYPGLGKWLSNQKTLCKKGKLKPERMQRLIDVGAIRDPSAPASSSRSARSPARSVAAPPQPLLPALGLAIGIDRPALAPANPSEPRQKRPRTTDSERINGEQPLSSGLPEHMAAPPAFVPAGVDGLFSESSPFRSFQGKPVLPSLAFPPHAAGGSAAPYLSFALTSMTPVIYAPYPVPPLLGAGAPANVSAPSSLI